MPASNHQLLKRTLNKNLNIMAFFTGPVRLMQELGEKILPDKVEIFSHRRSALLQLSHPHACNFALCLSFYYSLPEF